jgi:hypothetical protein
MKTAEIEKVEGLPECLFAWGWFVQRRKLEIGKIFGSLLPAAC